MRAFSFHWVLMTAAFIAVPYPAASVAGQFPGDVRVVVLDAATGQPVRAAELRSVLNGQPVLTGVDGVATLFSLEEGRHTLSVSALGYRTARPPVDAVDGRTVHVTVQLVPEPVELGGLTATATPESGSVLTHTEIRKRGTGSLASVLSSVPSVVVRSRGRGGAQTVSIRGSSEDAVLVLLDGVPLNDPITGEADLSIVPLAQLTRVTVLPGARSTRFGAGARAGVILLESGGRDAAFRGEVVGGSLDRIEGAAHGGFALGRGLATVDASFRDLDGSFAFALPSEVGGGSARRHNAEQRSVAATAGWRGRGPGGELTFRVGGEDLERGLPGRSFAPSPAARQELDRRSASASWSAVRQAPGPRGVSGFVRHQSVRFLDPAPPFGAPFDDTSRFLDAGGRFDALLVERPGVSLDMGVDVDHQAIDSEALAESAPDGRTDTAVRMSGRWKASETMAFTWGGRVHRDGLRDEWLFSHDLGVSYAPAPGLGLRASHRSSFSPPSLGDQFFREGVGVEPNPDLEAERVPGEWVAGARFLTGLRGLSALLDVEVYAGDVTGLILWQPDFRFVWSPRNTDVERRGVDVSARVESASLRLDGHLSFNRTTYDRPGDPVQVMYRPRWSGSVGGAFRHGSGELALRAVHTGARFPVPNAVNELPGFWAVDMTLALERRIGDVPLELRVALTRLFDAKDTLIFGFPDPGRTLSISLGFGR